MHLSLLTSHLRIFLLIFMTTIQFTILCSLKKDFDKFTTKSTKASAPAKVIAMSTALVIPSTIPEPMAITGTAVKTLDSLPSNFQHAMPSSAQQAIVAEAQVLHKDSTVGGEKAHVPVLTPGGSGGETGDVSHKGSAADLVTVPTLTVAPVDAGLSDKTIPTSNLWFGETDDGKASLETGSSVSSASPLSGYGKTVHVSPNFPYSSEVDYQSDPADFFPMVS